MEKKLNSMTWAIYNLLKANSDKWLTQYEIALELGKAYPELKYEGKAKDFHDSKARHLITDAIRDLNESGIIQKIILSGGKGVKIASEEEFDKYIGGMINSAVRRLKRVKQIAEKGNRHNQFRITLGKYERDIIEAFADGKEGTA